MDFFKNGSTVWFSWHGSNRARRRVEVELVNDSGLAGPALIAGGAIAAAIIAAVVAVLLVRKELAKDILVRRIEHARDAIDAAAELTHKALNARIQFELVIADWEVERPQLELEAKERGKSPGESDQLLERAREGKDAVAASEKAMTNALVEMLAAKTRLQLRLGSAHEIPRLFDELRESWSEIGDLYGKGVIGVRTSTEKTRCEEIEGESIDLYEQFHQACERWLEQETFA